MITRLAALLGIASISATGSAAARSAVSGSLTPEKAQREPSPYPRPEDCEIYTSGGSTWARRFDGEAPNGLRFYTAWEISR